MPDTETLCVDYEVRGYDCGYGGSLRPFSLANFLQETAGLHATALGVGIPQLMTRGQTWMLSRFDIRIDGLPRECETVRVRTRPSSFKKLFALRDIVLESASGDILARAVYAYLVVDLASRKPLRPERILRSEVAGLDFHAIEDYHFGCPAPEPADFVYAFEARPRHIDENGHVNNAYIVNWLVDAGAGGRLDRLVELRVDFLREILEGDEISAFVGHAASEAEGPAQDRRVIRSELRRGDEAAARAELVFRGR